MASKPVLETIDIEEGRFKYVLIKLKDKDTKKFRYIVRGYKWASFHAAMIDELEKELKKSNFICECVGGGRILHTPDERLYSSTDIRFATGEPITPLQYLCCRNSSQTTKVLRILMKDTNDTFLSRFLVQLFSSHVIIYKHITQISDCEFVKMAESGSPIIPNVEIDEDGTFKYILIRIKNKSNPEPRIIVRGYNWADYHADIFQSVEQALNSGYECECLGGGRIKHSSKEKTILVYGYSVGFGRADHSKTVALLQDRYSDYKSISFSNEGY